MKPRVDPPYHFGWRHDDDGGGTIQEVLDRDTCIYKDEEQWMTCLLQKNVKSGEDRFCKRKT